MGFFETFLTWLNTQLVQSLAQNLSRVAVAIEPAAITLAIVYVMVWGYLHLSGRIEEPLLDGARRIFILVVVFMAAQLVNWLKVLDHADLSYAKPFTSLSYVTVCILSVLLLGEHIAPLQIVGIVIVVAGVWCVSKTRRTTPGSGADPE